MRPKEWFQRAKPYLPALVMSSIIGWLASRAIVADAGGPGMPLDDSYIHFVYAKRFAEGAPFTFGPDGAYSSGATSFIWPLILAPFYLVGFRDLSLVYIVWVLGTLLHAATAVETKRLAEGLSGRAAGIGAGLACLLFGAFTWFAWSGMETMLLTWAMVRTMRLSSERAETEGPERTSKAAWSIAAMGAMTALVRPEGGALAWVAALGLIVFPKTTEGALRGRLPALLPVLATALVPLTNLVMLGHARGATAMVKWAVGNPYYQGERLTQAVLGNVSMLFRDLLTGGPYTAIFVPEYSEYFFLGGAIALGSIAARTRKIPRALFVAAIVLGTLIPCTFLTILWNRVRYIWPFATGWFILVACLASEAARLLERLSRRDSQWAATLITGLFAGTLSTKLNWTIKDLANSSRAITLQQVKLGRWAREHLPKDAVIGVNDTGAIAYFSDRQTFDVVGLTTEGEAPYWVAGAGSRFEHYEGLSVDARPTHFIVYPGWMGMPSILGRRLTEATVENQSILGGATKVAYEADWSVLGSAELPRGVTPTSIVDRVDVSDLASEKAHGFFLGATTDADNLVSHTVDEEGITRVDGGRHHRRNDHFTLRFSGESHRLVARVATAEALTLEVLLDGAPSQSLEVPPGPWQELSLPLGSVAPGEHAVSLRVRDAEPSEIDESGVKSFASLHYWLIADGP